MEKKKYVVTCTLIFNGYYEVEASSEDEAIDIMRERFGNINIPNKIDEFSFGEVTADYAEEL